MEHDAHHVRKLQLLDCRMKKKEFFKEFLSNIKFKNILKNDCKMADLNDCKYQILSKNKDFIYIVEKSVLYI